MTDSSNSPPTAPADDAALSAWGCSTRGGIFSYPSGFIPFAVALEHVRALRLLCGREQVELAGDE